GIIRGRRPIFAANSTAVTVVNHGTIQSGGYYDHHPVVVQSYAFVGGAGDDRVVVYPGAVFAGVVNALGGRNTLELAAGAGAGVIEGLGDRFRNFDTVSVDTGASWIFEFESAVTDSINLAAAQVEFSGAVQAGHTVAFTTGGATAKIDDVLQFAGKVTGFQGGDVLDFAGVAATGASYSPGTLTLLNGGSGFAQIAFATPVTNPAFIVTSDGSGGTNVTLTPVCFCRGTMLLTARGEVAVEDLKVGDQVKTLAGALK